MKACAVLLCLTLATGAFAQLDALGQPVTQASPTAPVPTNPTYLVIPRLGLDPTKVGPPNPQEWMRAGPISADACNALLSQPDVIRMVFTLGDGTETTEDLDVASLRKCVPVGGPMDAQSTGGYGGGGAGPAGSPSAAPTGTGSYQTE